jgi:hypothetical protein
MRFGKERKTPNQGVANSEIIPGKSPHPVPFSKLLTSVHRRDLVGGRRGSASVCAGASGQARGLIAEPSLSQETSAAQGGPNDRVTSRSGDIRPDHLSQEGNDCSRLIQIVDEPCENNGVVDDRS